MSTPVDTEPVTADDAAMRTAVERLLTRAYERPTQVAALTRTPSQFASLYPAEVLSVSLRGGRQLTLFVKHLGPEQADHPDKQCRDREIRVYEELLGDRQLPVARCYGADRDERTGRRALFIERVPDWDLRYHDLEHWFTAARRLAQLHAYFAGQAEILRRREFLLRLDADYLGRWANQALRVVGHYGSGLQARLSPLVGEHERAAEVLDRQPVTLVHNDLAPKNVLADRACTPARISFVDWEVAGVGCGLLDLVSLKYGLDPVSDEQMCAAYCAELVGTGLVPAEPDELRRVLAACELHRTFFRLAHSESWGVAEATVARWIDDASHLSARV